MTINDSGTNAEQRDEVVANLPASTFSSVNASSASVARRQMIASAVAAVPVVLTITAGVAKAQGPSMMSPVSDSQTEEEDPQTVDNSDSVSGSSSSSGSGSWITEDSGAAGPEEAPYTTNRNN